jgi:ribosome-binding protein aMBF1 (putative translation factor)
MSALYKRAPVLAGYLDLLAKQGARKSTRGRRPLKADRSLQVLVADLVAARASAGMTQEEVAVSMGTTKGVVSRLESGVCTRPTLRTIERWAVAVGALVEIRVRTRR